MWVNGKLENGIFMIMLKHSSVAFFCIALCLPTFVLGQRKKKEQIYTQPYIVNTMKKVCDWQLANPVSINSKNENDWARAAFYAGVMETYTTTRDEKYHNAAMAWSELFHWKLANRLRHADDQAKGQTYLAIYAEKKDPIMIEDIKITFDSMMLDSRPGREDW